MERATIGDSVVTLSGKPIGKVEHAGLRGVGVRTPSGEHLQLGDDAIYETGFGKVVLVCEQGGLRDYQDLVGRPAAIS